MTNRPDHARLRQDALRLLGGAVAVYVLLAGTGLLITRILVDGPVGRWDRDVSHWFFDGRTSQLNHWTHIGSMLSDTPIAIAVTAVLVIGLRLWLGRWRESAAILLSIVGELTIFVLVTATVHRQRPTVPHLDPAPPTSSFPSGHVGAAVALYVGLAVIVLTTTRRSAGRPAFVGASLLLCLVPVIVAFSRVYRGMHFATDVVAGALAGGLWMAVVMSTLLRDRGAATTEARTPVAGGRVT
ncbi:MAG: phosphatase PAP2 family protein [Actinomycetota bacterium]|nr:phosphatase PAP2 family protein [Actinomycetota bacterium]